MPSRLLKLEQPINLFELYYPSFALPLVDIDASRLAKLWGYCSKLLIEVEGSRARVVHEDRVCLDYAEVLLGRWLKLDEALHDVSTGSLQRIVEEVATIYGWLGVATSPKDDIELFASIYMSRNTDYHRNVLRWMKNILQLYGTSMHVAEAPIEELARRVGSSYQVIQLPTAIRAYLASRGIALGPSAWEARRAVMSIPFAGPKVADAFMLFVRLDPRYPPIDTNFMAFIQVLGLKRLLGDRLPEKRLCLRYTCSTCPAAPRCTSNLSRRKLGRVAGWLQTVAYVHVKRFCRTRSCNHCPLRHLCTAR